MNKTKHPSYRSWQQMMRRCYNSEFKHYLYYGGRGITVCNAGMTSTTSLQIWVANCQDSPLNEKTTTKATCSCRWATTKSRHITGETTSVLMELSPPITQSD